MPDMSFIKSAGHFDPRFWSLKDWKQIAFEVVGASSLVCNRPAFIFALWIASDGGGEADSIVYDGHNAGVLKLIHLDAVDEAIFQLRWFPPLYFQKGIYIDIGTNVAQVGIQYLPEPVE